jgi:hypothetical protein
VNINPLVHESDEVLWAVWVEELCPSPTMPVYFQPKILQQEINVGQGVKHEVRQTRSVAGRISASISSADGMHLV